ncbi:adenylate/guanylate cyclase domain-containing protein [Sulfitobacter sp. D35]|uniref:ATP-binding protein n=1 Tax=Sulfitobacter sp. D35 TaxID=3083252 RepID=UPI00296F1DFE|nr:adenylate/guanylate cyclase domain-containing protein [Sulfitobacter sp. D35]MDW4496504.1 adenylate/guanylate cyclase domain-containing protein [Sulfitobacter sp. D35]
MALSAGIEGQRRQVSVLFADIEGFTETAERIGDEAAFRLIQIVSAKMMEAVHAQGGSVQEFRGDGIMALFGAPTAIEDAPLRACRAALRIQKTIEEVSDDLEAQHGVRPRVRVGVHAGQLVVGEVGDDKRLRFTAIGDTVNLAARLEAEAEPGSIYVSEPLLSLVRGQVSVTDVGTRKVKGKSRPQQMYRLDAMKEGVSRFDVSRTMGLTELQERDAELSRLRDRFDRASAGNYEIVHVIGEAGIGKSRLMHEFRKSLQGMEDVLFLQGDCHADGAGTPFLPLVELVRNAFGITREDGRDVVETKLAADMQQIGFADPEALPYLMMLLSLDEDGGARPSKNADVIGQRMRQILMDLLWQACRTRKVVLFIEDLHWVDPDSEELLTRIARSDEGDTGLMLVCAFRPYYAPPWEKLDNVSSLRVQPLSKEGTIRLLFERLGITGLEAEMVGLAVDKVEGNPLYAEEIARFLQEQRTASAGKPQKPDDVVLPANLQNLVMDRFDRLNRDTRTMLQAASVAGRRFNGKLIRDLLGLDSPVEDLLAEAEHHDLVRRVENRDTEYFFKHVLVQDAIYDTLMAAARTKLHADVGLAIEAEHAGRTEDVADILAYHFERSELHDRTVRYLAAAGRKSLSLFSLEVADANFARAVELIESHVPEVDPELHADIFRYWLEVQQWRADFAKSKSTFEPRMDTLRSLVDTNSYPRALALLGVAYAQILRFDEASKILREAMAIGEARQDHETIGHACIGLMGLHCNRWSAKAFDGIHELDRIARDAVDMDRELYLRMYCEFFVAWGHSQRGDMDIAREMGLASIEHGRARKYPGSVGYGCIAVAFNDGYSERYESAIAYAEEGARSSGGFIDQCIAQGIKGLAMALSGDGEGGLKLLHDLAARLEGKDFQSIYNIVDMPTGVAMVQTGDLSGGVTWIERCVGEHGALGNVHGEAMGNIVLGEIYLALAIGSEKPELRVLLKNALFLLRNAPFAKTRALAHFERASALGIENDMFGIAAQALYDKAMTLRAMKRPSEALAALREAQQVCARIRWRMMADKIDDALSAAVPLAKSGPATVPLEKRRESD